MLPYTMTPGSALCVCMCSTKGRCECVRMGDLRITVFCSVIPGWVLISGRDDEYCSHKNTVSQHHNLWLPTTGALKDEYCPCELQLDVFLCFSQWDMLAWNFFYVPEQKSDILRTSKNTNQIMATVNIIWSCFNVHWHVWPNDPIPLWYLVPGALRQVCFEFRGKALPGGRV